MKELIKKIVTSKLKKDSVVFLGGTCNNSTWREELIPLLEKNEIKYFNPIVSDWNEEAQKREDEIKDNDKNINLFVITKEMTGAFSIAEVVDSSNKKPKNTIFMVKKEGFDKHQLKSLNAVENLVKKNGAQVVDSLEEIVKVLKK